MNAVVENIAKSMALVGLSDAVNVRLLVALSGGADSVALLLALLELGYTCIAAHCNFHLRGDESMRDEQFVRNLCQNLGVELHVKDFDVMTYKREHKSASTEMACRNLRYDWFQALSRQLNCRRVVVAHHADDNVETFFINLLRGTGISGLVGMSQGSRVSRVARPMLQVTRQQVLDYLAEVNQDYVTDSTNLENDYNRNRLRNVVLPTIDKQFDQARLRITDTMNHLNDEKALLDYLVGRFGDEVGSYDEGGDIWCFRKDDLCRAPQPGMALYALIRHMGFNRVQCDQAMQASVGSKFTTLSHTLIIERDVIVVQGNASVSEPGDKQVDFVLDWTQAVAIGGELNIITHNPPFDRAMVDGRLKVAFNNDILRCKQVLLRHWRQGDRFRPYGMKGSKLLSDLFVDLRLSTEQKKAVWLMEADGEIVWVLGHRAAQAYVVNPGSTDYVLLKYLG